MVSFWFKLGTTSIFPIFLMAKHLGMTFPVSISISKPTISSPGSAACGPAARTNIDGCLVTPWQLLQSCSAFCGAGKLRPEVEGDRTGCVLENCWLPSYEKPEGRWCWVPCVKDLAHFQGNGGWRWLRYQQLGRCEGVMRG